MGEREGEDELMDRCRESEGGKKGWTRGREGRTKEGRM